VKGGAVMVFAVKNIQLLAISPERGVAYVRYGDSGIFSIGPPSFRRQSVQNWETIQTKLEDFFKEEELARFRSDFSSWDEFTKYLQKLYVESNRAMLHS
jgi:hypothetical protein